MLHRCATAALIVTPLALLAACRKGGPPGEADASASSPTLTAGELCDVVFGASVRQLSASCTADDQQKKQHAYLVGRATGAVAQCKEELEPLAARGDVRLDAEAAQRCGKLLESTSWKERFASPDVPRFPECRGLVTGTVAEGQPCESGVVCAAGLVCARGAEAQGRCEKPGGAAPACVRSLVGTLSTSRPCGPGASCPIAGLASTVLGAPAAEPPEAAPPGSASAEALPTLDPRQQALHDAVEFGMIGLLNPGALDAQGIDALDRPEGIGLGAIGTIGHGAGTGTGQGFGSSRLGGAGRTKPPQVRAGATQVSGRLPPEVIQRIVRRNFGRFRLCYENGLRGDPGLAGRVSVKFVIARDGSVSSVADGGSDLRDAGVVACVVRAFHGLSFPAPEGGIVVVVHPLLFAPGEGADAGAAAPPDAGAQAPESPSPPATAAPAPEAKPGQLACAPVIPAGQACDARGVCADGLACRVHRCSSDPPAAAGGACVEEDDCRPGLYCSRAQGLHVLGSPGICAARKPEGAACSSSLQCGGICLASKCAAFCGAR